MKKLRYMIITGVVLFAAIVCLPHVFAEPLTINISPDDIGNGKKYKTLQDAFDAVDEGGTINLQKGDYNNGKVDGVYAPVVINKAMTVNGEGSSTILWAPIQIKETEKDDKVVLNNFGRPIVEPTDQTIFIDVQSSVNLLISNSNLYYMIRNIDKKVETLHLGKETDNSTILIKDSQLRAIYDGIFVESSNNNITIDNSIVTGRYALTFQEGENNNIDIINNSRIDGRVYLTDRVSQEGIRIISQNNLTLNVVDSEVTAANSNGNAETHIISFDGNKASTNTKINFKGNSKLVDLDPDGILISFGKSNTPNHSNVLTFESTVEMTKDVNAKYDDSEGGEYYVVGIFDKDGKLTVKTYGTNTQIPESDLPGEIDGYRLDGLYKNYSESDGYTNPFEKTSQVNENMDIYPNYIKIINVTIDDDVYSIDEKQKLSESSKHSEIESELNRLKSEIESSGMTFVGFSDGNEIIATTVEELMEKSFTDDVTIKPISKITITLEYGEQQQTFDYEANKNLGDLYQTLVDTASAGITEKTLSKIYDTSDGSKNPISENTKFNKNVTLKALYSVTVKYGENEVTIDENGTIASKYSDWEAKANEPTDKKFKHFEDEDGTVVTEHTTFAKNTVITAKYTVEVKFNGYTIEIDEGSSIGEEEYSELLKKADVSTKKFNSFKIKGESTAIGPDTPIHKNIELEASYKIDVTYGEVTVPLDEGAALGEDNYKKLEAEAKKDIEGKKDFQKLVDGDDTVTKDTTFNKNTLLNAIYTVNVTFNGKKTDIVIEADTALGESNYDKLVELANEGITNKTLKYLEDADGNKITKDTVLKNHTNVKAVYYVSVTLNDLSIELEENTALGEDNYNSLVNKAKENITGKEFKELLDSANNKITKDTTFTKDTTLKAVYNVHVSYNGEVVLTLEEGATLTAEDYKKLEALAKVTGKNLDGFKALGNKISVGDKILNDIEVVAVYKVTVTYKDVVITLDDGAKLTESEKNRLINAAEVDNKEFAYFTYNEHKFDIDSEVSENTVLTANYNVKVTIKDKSYLIEEGKSLNDSLDFDEIYVLLEELKTSKEQEFSRFVDDDGKTIETDTPLSKNTVITPKFNIVVTIDDEVFTLEEGQSLSDLTSKDKERFNALKTKTGYKLVQIEDEEGNVISENTPLNSDITLKLIFEKVSAVVNPSTFDNIIKYVILGIISFVGITFCMITLKKQNKKIS